MCATNQQNQLETEEAQAYTQAQQLTAEQYANQQAIYAPMAAKFNSIFNAGPNQQGFSTAEVQGLNAQAVEGTAVNYQAAAKAVGEQTAAEGGGTNPLPTGGQTELKEQVAESAAANESQQETQIQEANYSQGLANWQNAAGGLETIASGENPLGYENAETGAAGTANSEANAIASEDTGWESAVLGGVAGLGEQAIKTWG